MEKQTKLVEGAAERPIERTVLITGASSGIGKVLADECAAHGHDLVLVARDRAKLDQLAGELASTHGIRVEVISCDLAQPNAPDELFTELTRRGIDVDILINNAGLGLYGPFLETALSHELAMIQLNVVALTALTKRALPPMVARGRGRVLNVASTAAFQPGPLMAVYFATKAFVLSLSEALSNELEGTGVTVTALCPGPTETGFQAGAKMEASKLVQGRQLMSAAEVARIGYRALLAGRRVVVPGIMNKLMASSTRFLPRSTVTSAVRRAQERAPS
jgi:short-subunit dehydrogenase